MKGKERLGDEYNRVTEEYTLLEMEFVDAQRNWLPPNAFLKTPDIQLKRLEEKRLAVEELKRREARINEGIANSHRNAQALNRNIEGKQAALGTFGNAKVTLKAKSKLAKPNSKDGDALRPARGDFAVGSARFDNHISNLKGEKESHLPQHANRPKTHPATVHREGESLPRVPAAAERVNTKPP